MRLIKVLVLLMACMVFSYFSVCSAVKVTPRQTVMNFINDYQQWNEEATQNISEDTGFQAKDEYIKLLNKYCTQSTSRIGYDVYGQYSLHIADGEKILNTKKNDQEVIIKTGVSSRFGDTDAGMDYFEYHLILDKNKYLIEEVYQLSKSGKKTKTL